MSYDYEGRTGPAEPATVARVKATLEGGRVEGLQPRIEFPSLISEATYERDYGSCTSQDIRCRSCRSIVLTVKAHKPRQHSKMNSPLCIIRS